MKDLKTTIAGVIGAIIVAGETLLPYFEGEGEISWAQVIAAVVILVGGYFAKDKDSDNAEASTINPDPKPPRPGDNA